MGREGQSRHVSILIDCILEPSCLAAHQSSLLLTNFNLLLQLCSFEERVLLITVRKHKKSNFPSQASKCPFLHYGDQSLRM